MFVAYLLIAVFGLLFLGLTLSSLGGKKEY
jgi:hypothetical protein